MDYDIVDFSEMFPDENHLQQCVASLLRRIEGNSGVEITQGPHELGKDIVYRRSGGLGEPKLYACVLKNKKIIGTVASKDGATTVLHQARQALEEGYITGTGKREYPEHVYVMCPHDCAQSTMDSISGQLQSRAITFFCGTHLLDVFQKYWPEFLIFNSGVLSTYVANLKRGLDEDNPLRYLSGRHSMLASTIESFAKVYVRQDFRQQIEAHELRLDIPVTDGLERELTLCQVEEIQSALRRVASLLAVSSTWVTDISVSDLQQADRAISECVRRLRPSWNQSYEGFAREKSLEGTKVSRTSASVRIADATAITDILIAPFAIAQTVRDRLEALLKEANRFVAANPKPHPKIITSSGFLQYCVVQELARKIPEVVSAKGSAKPIHLASDVTRELNTSILIVGPAGYGKSSFCKWNVFADIDNLRNQKSVALPVHVQLHQIARLQSTNPEELFFRSSEIRELIASGPQYSDSVKQIRLYLDGLDEVPSINRQKEILESAKQLCDRDPRITVMVTARDHVCGPWLNWMPRIKIREFSNEQTAQLIAKWIPADEQRAEFLKQLESARSLQPLMSVPLLATLIIAVFRKLRKLPETKNSLYDLFVELMTGGWDLAKNVKRESKFGSLVKLSILSTLAGRLHLNEKRDCPEADLHSVIKERLPDYYNHSEDLVRELIEDGLLIQSGAALYFSHLSFQEYLAAKDLADPSGRRPNQVLRWFLNGKDWWREVLFFYIGMQSPQSAEQWIRNCTRNIRAGSPTRVPRQFNEIMEHLVETFPGYRPKSLHLDLSPTPTT